MVGKYQLSHGYRQNQKKKKKSTCDRRANFHDFEITGEGNITIFLGGGLE